MLEYSWGKVNIHEAKYCSQLQHLSSVIAWRRLQAPADRRLQARDGEQHAFQAPSGPCATERAPELRPLSKIILFHFVMEPRVK